MILQSEGGFGQLLQLLPFALVFAIFYFLLILPTQKRQKKEKEMLDNLKSGDRVITKGGIRGTIVSLRDDILILRVPPQDIRLEVVRSAVSVVEESKD
jgi:preprotein translocase subunit YajC